MKNKIENITIGTDAELFLKHEGDIISVIGNIGGTKKDPIPIGNDCFMQEDNILAEFNIPPVTSKEDFIKYITYCKDWIYINLPELEMHFSSSEIVNDFIISLPNAKEFGCEPDCIVDLKPDTDCMTKDEHEMFNQERMKKNLRTSGFHIHIGYSNPDIETNRELVKLFEKHVTMALLPLDLDNHNRRSMYGKSGSYRNKPYGVECRSLGGYFIANNKTIGKVWDLTQIAINKFNEGERVTTEEFKKIKQIINNKQTNICVD